MIAVQREQFLQRLAPFSDLEAAVGLLVAQAIINRLTGVRYPFWASVPAPKIGVLASRGALQRFTRFLWLG